MDLTTVKQRAQTTGYGLLALVITALTPSHAADSVISSFTASGSAGTGQNMANNVGGQLNNVTQLIWGPGMYVVMAIGALLAVFGWFTGKKELLWTGIGGFVLGAVLRALVPVFFA